MCRSVCKSVALEAVRDGPVCKDDVPQDVAQVTSKKVSGLPDFENLNKIKVEEVKNYWMRLHVF